MNSNNLIAGLGGAIVLTLLNESLKRVSDTMPRIDLVGEEAVLKTAAYFGVDIQNSDTLYGTTLVSDLVSNATYFSLISGEGSELWTKAASAGIVAGVGAINLPDKLNLDDTPVAKSFTTKAFTIGYYLMGALTTAAIIRLIEKK